MSAAANVSRNNQGTPPSASDTRLSYIHDAKYYQKDGSVTVLVEGILFKFPAYMILRSGPTPPVESTDGDTLIGINNLPRNLTKSSDEDPIVIPNVRANQFRNFLFAIMGLPYDPEYRALMVAAQDKKQHNQNLLLRYLDIACLAWQFGMTELEEWARSQLCLVLKSAHNLALTHWDAASLLRLDSYTRTTNQADLISLSNTFMQYCISTSAEHHNDPQSPPSTHLGTCVELYKDPTLRNSNPALFGCVFLAILSLGRRSRIWNQQLTQGDRRLLYVAQATLTSVSTELKSVTWLKSSTRPPLFKHGLCGGCWAQFNDLWTTSFGRCEGLKSEVTLQDVTALAHLPQFRRDLVAQWDTTRACLIAASSKPIRFRCLKLKAITNYIDDRIRDVYQEIARRHAGFASEA